MVVSNIRRINFSDSYRWCPDFSFSRRGFRARSGRFQPTQPYSANHPLSDSLALFLFLKIITLIFPKATCKKYVAFVSRMAIHKASGFGNYLHLPLLIVMQLRSTFAFSTWRQKSHSGSPSSLPLKTSLLASKLSLHLTHSSAHI